MPVVFALGTWRSVLFQSVKRIELSNFYQILCRFGLYPLHALLVNQLKKHTTQAEMINAEMQTDYVIIQEVVDSSFPSTCPSVNDFQTFTDLLNDNFNDLSFDDMFKGIKKIRKWSWNMSFSKWPLRAEWRRSRKLERIKCLIFFYFSFFRCVQVIYFNPLLRGILGGNKIHIVYPRLDCSKMSQSETVTAQSH